jgi:RNA polymerase sigma-70 factor (ECF subfamily)
VFEGLSQADAATLLGLSAKAVETRVYRAKQKLREALELSD